MSEATAVSAASSALDTNTIDGQPISTALTLRELLLLRAGEAIVAALFIPFLPLWKPLTWMLLAWSVNIGIYLIRKSRWFARCEPTKQLRVVNLFAALDALAASSACYLLLVADNIGMRGILYACLIVVALMWVLERPRNSRAGGLGAAVILVPAALLPLALPGGFTLFNAMIAVGIALVALLMWLFAIKQETTITEQVRLRRQAELAVDAIAEAGASKDRFFASASHDLRQPVHAIGLYLAPLMSRSFAPEDQRALAGIHQSWKVLDGLLTQIMDLARSDNQALQAQNQPVLLSALVQDVVYTLYPLAEKKSLRVVVLVSEAAWVIADHFMLRRTLSNLLDNAIKFSHEGASIVMAARRRGGGRYWAIEVRDSGIGITADDQPKIFDEFVQVGNAARNRLQGFGLGLAVVKRFAALMGGTLHVRSALGRGTTVTLSLLLGAAPSAMRSPPDEPRSGNVDARLALAPSSTLTDVASTERSPLAATSDTRITALGHCLRKGGQCILLVEDDAMVAGAFVSVMEWAALPVIHVETAEAALPHLPKAAIAVCDMRLPGQMDGLALAQHCRAQRVPAVLITGEDSPATKAQIKAAGIPMLQKPVSADALFGVLVELVDS